MSKREERLPCPETVIRRMKMAVVNQLLGAEYGTVAALMRARGQLTDGEYEAALWFQQLYLNYCRAIGVKPLIAREYGRVSRGSPVDPESPSGSRINRRDRIFVERYGAAYRALRDRGPAVCDSFYRFVIDDCGEQLSPDAASRLNLIDACSTLRRHREGWRARQRVKRAS